MYQGKFDAKNRGRASAVDVRPARREEPAEQELPLEEVLPPEQETAQDQGAPVQPDDESKKDIKKAKRAAKKAAKKAYKKRSRTGTIIFYTLYFLLILAFAGGVYYAYGLVNDWLIDYQAAQPTTRCKEVFQKYFADPDWGTIYDMAGVQDTTYEGRDAFVSYMEEKVGDSQLTYMETSAGLSGNKKYYVKLGDENIACFLLEGEENTESGIPHWELCEVEVYFTRNQAVTVEKMAGHTVYVNGVPLDDSFTVRTIYTVAEEYLPDDLVGLRMETQQLSGLLVEPEITVLDKNGENVEVTYDPETDVYSALITESVSTTISAEEENVVLKAGESYALYMIEKVSADTLLKYYDKNSNVYQAITKMDMWMQNCNGYEFANQSVTDYYRYSDTLFSANVYMDLNVTRTNNTVKTYTVDTTLFFEYQSKGWKCIEMTNVNVLEEVSEVRITFTNEGVELSTGFYNTNTRQLEAPVISVPEGKVFSGWYRETVDETGATTYTLVFTPDENGIVSIPSGYELEPMTLFPLFDDEVAVLTLETGSTEGTEATE